MQDEIVRADFDIVAESGGRYKATAQSFDFTVADGEGLLLELINKTSTFALLSGLEITRNNLDGAANPTADVELSTDGGVSWSTLASAVELDRFGKGEYLWTADVESPEALVRIRANNANQTSDISDGTFSVANGGNFYYVNDDSLIGDEYTTAIGDNANDGKNPDAPMASLAALLRVYDLEPGDTVFVDTGVYNLSSNIRLEAEDSGVRIQGAVGEGNRTLLDRGNTASSSRVFDLVGVSNMTLDSLSITGGHQGIAAYSGNSDVTLSNNEIFNNVIRGIDVRAGNTGFLIEGNEVYGHADSNDYGIYVENVTDIEVRNNDVRANYFGISVGNNVVAFGNEVYNNYRGISGSGNSLIEDNEVYQNSEIGIYLRASFRARTGRRESVESSLFERVQFSTLWDFLSTCSCLSARMRRVIL